MTSYWPSGLELKDTQSPLEILQEAKKEWEANSAGALTLVFQSTKSESGNEMIIVHAKHLPSERTATLLSVLHRETSPYPATIDPRDVDLPNFLKKSYYRPAIHTALGQVLNPVKIQTDGYTVTNEWVSDTPAEFRKNLQLAFNLGTVKSEILNLACGVTTPDTNVPGNG